MHLSLVACSAAVLRTPFSALRGLLNENLIMYAPAVLFKAHWLFLPQHWS